MNRKGAIKTYITENMLPTGIAIFQWIITTILKVDKVFFDYDHITFWMLGTKALYLAFLILMWVFIFYSSKKIKSGDAFWKRGFNLFCVYLTIMLGILLIVWPGMWSWDDLWILKNISGYENWCAWQHTLTGAYEDVLLQILPFPGGMILLQNIIISVCVAWSVTKLENVFELGYLKNRIIDYIAKLLPFLLIPVIRYQFSGYRMGLYVQLEMILMVMLICAWKEKKSWNYVDISMFAIIGAIVAAWRSESLLYIPSFIILLYFVKKEVLTKKKKIICILMLCITYFVISFVQKKAMGDSKYSLVSIMKPCVEVVRAADAVKDAEELAAIDRVTSVQVILDNPTMDGEALYWSNECARNKNDDPDDDFTDEEYSEYIKAFIKLSFKYPGVVISERWITFIDGCGATGKTWAYIPDAADLFDSENMSQIAEDTQSRNWIAFKPISKDLRRDFINLIGARRDDGTDIIWLKLIIWNAIIPELILIISWFRYLFKKEWYYWGIVTAILIRMPVVALGEPTAWIMYHLSFYLLGCTYIVYKGLIIYKRKETNK